ncbi:MAG TPA: hypothetical protein VHF89_12765 [Solirubrobacteraceae bacterium]|nr:hypothetical protein [Solirubrobacteraceae bacterium]
MPDVWRARMEAVRDRPGIRWVAAMYARHREPRPAAARRAEEVATSLP